MRDLRVKRVTHNPNAAILTPTGWQMPDGTFKPFYTRQAPIQPQQRPSFFARWVK